MDQWNENKEPQVKLKYFGIPRIMPYIKPHGKLLITMMLLLLVDSGISLITPLAQKYAIDLFIVPRTVNGLWIFIILYVLLVFVQGLCGMKWTRLSIDAEMYVARDLRRAAFNHLQTLSFTYFNQNAVGYIHARVISDSGRIAGMASWGLVDTLWTVIYVLGSFAIMLTLNWKLALIVIIVMPLLVIISTVFRKKLVESNRRVREINSRITGNFNEGITGAKTTKTLVIEDKMEREFDATTDQMERVSVRTSRYSALFISISTLASSIAVALVMYYGGILSRDGVLLIGTLSAFVNYALNLVDPIQNIARTITDLITVQVNIERITRLIETEPIVKDSPEVIEKYGDVFDPKKENWEEIKGDISFRDVSFMYPDGTEYVLEHFNLEVPAGTCVAIVGETGAGKSTLVNLVCRFYEPTSGQILIDGRDYRERSQLWLHSNIGYVLQSPHLFSGSVLENLKYGNPDATMEQIEAAIDAVSARGIIEKLDKGYDSDVGESGDLLSTGEKQLLSFARAILADPHIFVLDEATSSVDTITEQLIQNAIDTLLEGRTSFIIAHRLSTIRRADLILVVRDGKIIEQGTHEELLKMRGYYHSLYTRQYEEEATELSIKQISSRAKEDE